jgi:hypothetical protein
MPLQSTSQERAVQALNFSSPRSLARRAVAKVSEPVT